MSVTAVLKVLVAIVAGYLLLSPGLTPESTITEFIGYVNSQDYRSAARLVHGGKPNENYSTIISVTRGIKVTIGSMKSAIKGNRAKVTLTATLSGGSRPPQTESEEVSLVKVNGQWLIVPPTENTRGTGMISSMAGVTTGPTKAFADAREAAKKTACLSNLKQLALAAIMHSTDYDDVFKFDASNAKSALRPYTKNDQLWFCPAGSKTVAAYSFNQKLAGKSTVAIRDPANTVMLYEGSKGKLDFRHNGTAAVAFADGHVRAFTAAQAAKLNWNP